MRNIVVFFALVVCARAGIFSTVRGIVHDPSHRPVADADIVLQQKGSDHPMQAHTGADGVFTFTAVPAGEYVLHVSRDGFEPEQANVEVTSGTEPVFHFALRIAAHKESVDVSDSAQLLDTARTAPATLVTAQQIAQTPGASLTNSLAMITDFVPGAYVTHDQLHVRGGHQVTWAIDGVPIPNSNIASNVGPQIDPKDVDTLEALRGGYSSEYGDRTYGVFDIVPNTGFERDRDIELNTTYGSFQQTNDQISIGDHNEKLAYFLSLDGNRSNYGLETPGPAVQHDAEWGAGGFGSLIYNANASNQFRLVASSRADDYDIPGTTGDIDRERDTLADFTWLHTFSPNLLLTVSPFFHVNDAHYDGAPDENGLTTIQHLDSTYAGVQAVLNPVTATHDARIGFYGFGEHENEFISLTEPGASVQDQRPATGQLEAYFAEDQWKLTPYLTLTGGLRATHFAGALTENAVDPRVGAAVRIPHLNWTLRGFFGTYYQAPPLLTVAGPVLQYAVSQALGVIPLKGERDQENQVGLNIPLRGWNVDINSFRQRATNYFDHNSLGESNIFFPISIAGARIYGQEVTIHSPRLWHGAEASIAYSYQHAEGEGAITGGLTDFSPPDNGWFFLDHDQRHTLHGNLDLRLPKRAWMSVAAYYGSGFTDGDSAIPAHLEPHTTFDVALGKDFGESFTVSLNGLNVTNRRFLLDNSETFGGTHYADPRQIYVEFRYRFLY